VTFAGGFDASTQGLLNVTVIRYDPKGRPQEIIFADRARYNPPSWTFENATTYHFAPDGTTQSISSSTLEIDVGAKPNQIVQHAEINDPEQLSRGEIADRIASGQLSPAQVRHFRAVYASKLARPFAAFVFTLIAVPFGLRPVRGGGTGLGFGLAVAIVFVYYVISTVFLTVGGLEPWLAGPAAWAPNVLFTLIGGWLLLRRASAV
jgi:lipopolysaccharide export system permease protein